MKISKHGLKGVSLILLFFMFDYFTKLYISKHIPLNGGVGVIDGFFNIVHVRNTGVAFGIFAHLPEHLRFLFLGGISLVVFVVIFYLVLFGKDRSFLFILGLSFLAGGDLGNLYDRIFRGYVIDFLDFHINRYHYPAFNLADSFITIGLFILIFYRMVGSRIKNA
ncbi:signal peptidase II [Hippea maritima]|uniref:Lipoprotein signal peptidase n=1 Tax=Hippea maritima (strain ATCC 700847 / DSM 10411 / MH2) TaxID=760142 RepID=F2LXR2_HIPMA|nr:signal peptidase II [Hippea maritima]AEA34303.1 Lipoprotein signal peptidase [Hippea maritima DSM 10411]